MYNQVQGKDTLPSTPHPLAMSLANLVPPWVYSNPLASQAWANPPLWVPIILLDLLLHEEVRHLGVADLVQGGMGEDRPGIKFEVTLRTQDPDTLGGLLLPRGVTVETTAS